MQPIKITANLESLEVVSQYVAEAAKLACLDKRKGYKLLLAADELVTNIINHGYIETGKAGNISIAAELDENENQLHLSFEDDAASFDPSDFQPPDLSLSLELRPIGGLGLLLIHQNVDQLQYQRLNNLNRTVLSVKCENNLSA